MHLALAPYSGEPEFADPAYTGEWAPAFVDMPLATPPWCSYAVRKEGALVGSGGFKGPPDDDGFVEIAYITFVPVRGGGIASALAAELIAIARASGVAKIRAHTLTERNASTRVLEANGFMFAGEVIDPEDGAVWRWER